MLVIPLTSKNDKSQILTDNLPEDIRTTIFAYSNLFQEKGIIPLLESSEENFEKQFQITSTYLYNYMISVGDLIIQKQKEYPNLLLDLVEYNTLVLNEFSIELKKFSDYYSFKIILESLTVFQEYLMATMNPKFQSILNSTEYLPAVESMVYVMVCFGCFLQSIKNPKHRAKILALLLDKLLIHKKNLESYVETVEIETDPDQMEIFERTKKFE